LDDRKSTHIIKEMLKGAEGMTQVKEHLASKQKALNSKASTIKKKKKKS
jgi:hypothetical protein